jgi:hypothetical protein
VTAEVRYLEVDRAQLRWDVVDLESLSVSEGVGSTRHLDRLCQRVAAYRRLCTEACR